MGLLPSLSIMDRTSGCDPGSVRSNRAETILKYRRMAKLASRPALNRKNAGSVSAPLRSALNEAPLGLQRPAAPAYGACRLTVKTPDCGSGDEGCLKKIYETAPDVRKELIIPAELPDELYAQQWQSKPFRLNEIGENVPEHYSNKGERVRSKSEVMIADALAQAGLPYRYECPLMLGTAVVHPDFTILRREDRKELFWEHLGRMDDAGYVMKNLSKIRLYEQNGIMPGIDLILTMETSQQPINLSVIKQVIRTYCI